MLNNRIVSGIISTTLLLTPTNTVSASTNVENEISFNKINNDNTPKIYDENYYKLKEEFKTKQNIINRVNERFDRIEEQRRQEEEKKRKEEEERNSYDQTYLITYYSRHPSENGEHNCTAYSTPLREGICANNIIPRGTKIKLIDGRELIVEDKGGTEFFNNDYHLDVFVDTYDVDYVNKLGSHYIKGKIIKE